MSQEDQASEAIESAPLVFRPGTPDDEVAIHDLFLDSIYDLVWRMGIQDGNRYPSPEERADDLRRWRPVIDHLSATADQCWIAERAGKPVGFARSVLRDGVRELTEFFVSPHAQAGGIGRELLARAMPPGARRTYIIATVDLRAQARYHKLGVYQICTVFTFERKPEQVAAPANAIAGQLRFVSITPELHPILAELDLAVYGHRRDEEHAWLTATRSGFLLLRNKHPRGYGYVGSPFSGPFVMLDVEAYPTALAYAERVAYAQGVENLAFDVPMLNRIAIDYLLQRSYRMSPFFCFYMCDEQPAHVDKTIITAPMILV